ncbi:MAG: acetyl-CoA carboxylase biotin carboxylase subunit [Pseudomonadales bacterium]|nr:acetyl-CoA carboxylase biotin carboxylase subunit [Pseudomonadales bacterium]
MFNKILVANRGEIACRVIRTAQKLGIRSVAVYSDADANALHVQMADEAVHIGASAPTESYLAMDKIISAAKRTNANAIHPGYGFLSENSSFCQLCAANNIVFIGPPVGAIESMGSKSAAKQIMEKAEVPLLPGYHGADQDPTLLLNAAQEIGYPVLLKAVSGGGGKGMRQISSEDEFDEGLAAAKREALSSFGDDAMLVEKYLQQPRHVEVQVFCDKQGNGVYLFERDCSIQRRHQKIIEEAPAPNLSQTLREKMGQAALRAASAVDYVGAGTVEFLLDSSGEFFFMEMNTRLQVEHPVTEMITGLDLVEWQIRVANGEPLPCDQGALAIQGHAFEARVYAEDPDNEFLPAAGKLVWLEQPTQTPNVRIDTGVIRGDEVGVFYDPMIAKLIVWDENRERALARLAQALNEYRIVGVTTNVPFLHRLATNTAFEKAELSTDFISQQADTLFQKADLQVGKLIPIAGLYLTLSQQNRALAEGVPVPSPWHARDYWRLNASSSYTATITAEQVEYEVKVTRAEDSVYEISFGDHSSAANGTLDGNRLTATIDGHKQVITALPHGTAPSSTISLFTEDGAFEFSLKLAELGEDALHDDGAGFKAPMNGTLVDILVGVGESVSAGDTLVIMEAMKMEHPVKAPTDGIVTEIFFTKGDLVDGGAELLAFEANG